jgi:23S rRNA (guanosine2251-2'-O)-methyltransferase
MLDTIRGIHAVREALAATPGQIRKIVLVEGRLDKRLSEIAALARARGIPVYREPRERLGRFGGPHQGVVAEIFEFRWRDLDVILDAAPDPALILVLDQVEDPRNLGACLRTADAAGVDAVVVPRSRSAKLSGAALKAATGAAETVPLIVVPNLARALRWLRDAGVRLVGADERGERPHFDAELAAPVAIVLGAEGAGLRRLTREACDELVRIPMRGTVTSLNVSVAAGILLYEMLRQGR